MELTEHEKQEIKRLIALELKRIDSQLKTLEKEYDYISSICGNSSLYAINNRQERFNLNSQHTFLRGLIEKL